MAIARLRKRFSDIVEQKPERKAQVRTGIALSVAKGFHRMLLDVFLGMKFLLMVYVVHHRKLGPVRGYPLAFRNSKPDSGQGVFRRSANITRR